MDALKTAEAPPITPAKPSGKYTIFFSHKHDEEKATRDIIDIVRHHTDGVDCFISEDIERGTDWRKEIAEKLSNSDFLVLVFTDPEEDWKWCLYETGFFDALSQLPGGQARRIYCLHNESSGPPNPIASLQSIPANVKAIKQWITELFEKTKQNRPEFIKDIPIISEQICNLFLAERKHIYDAKSISLDIKCSVIKSPHDLPDDTLILGEKGLMEELFGTGSGKLRWGMAKQRFGQFLNSSEVNLRTLREISRASYSICNDNKPLPIQGTIFVGDGPKRYRPVINHAKQVSSDLVSCEILLTEDAGGPLQNVDRNLGVLLTTMRMAVRIRWEIVKPFTSRIDNLATENPKKLRSDLQTCLNNIFSEAEFRGTYSSSDVTVAFDKDEEKTTMRQIINASEKTFQRLWRSIGFDNMSETFGKVSASPFSAKDKKLLNDGLAELGDMNARFLGMAAIRLDQLIQEELKGAERKAPQRRRKKASPLRT